MKLEPPPRPPRSPSRPPSATGTPGVTPMALGVGGCNIDQPPSYDAEVPLIIQDPLYRSLTDPGPGRHPPKKIEIAVPVWVGRLSLAWNILLIISIIGFMTLAPGNDESRGRVRIQSEMMPSHATTGARLFSHPPSLLAQSQETFTNDLLLLAISLEDNSSGQTVILKGLVSGFEVAAGTSLGEDGWRISAVDVDKAWVSAPVDFVGAIDVTVNLHHSNGQLLQRQGIQLEWVARREATPSTRSADSGRTAPALRPLDADKIAILSKFGQGLLQDGEIAAARSVLERAARAGDAQASLALGMTFDPGFVRKWGLLPDVKQANIWYERASHLGSIEALRHHEHLDQAQRSAKDLTSSSDLPHR